MISLLFLFTVNTSFGQAQLPNFAWGEITDDVTIKILMIFGAGALLFGAIFCIAFMINWAQLIYSLLSNRLTFHIGALFCMLLIAMIAIPILDKDQGKHGQALIENPKTNPSKIFTRSEVEEFMEERTKKFGQTIQEIKESTHSNGDKIYLFLSVAINGNMCITTVSSIKLEVLVAKCGENHIDIIESWQMIE